MKGLYEVLEDMSEMLTKKLMEAREKAHVAGSLSSGDIEYLDRLLHSIKSIKTTMAMIDAEESGSYDGGSGRWSQRSYADHSNADRSYADRSYADSYDGGSNARGRRNAKRDSMGRYSSRMSGGFKSDLQELMEDAPNDQIRQEIRRLISQVEE